MGYGIDTTWKGGFEERPLICGDLWPHGMATLSNLELFERVLTCNRNRWICYTNAAGTKREDQHTQDMIMWAAWGNAEQLYTDELRVRLGGVGEVFQNQPRKIGKNDAGDSGGGG